MNILHIEDHTSIIELVRHLCNNKEPFYVDGVTSLAEAREKLADATYDLLLIDLNLGDSYGMETIKALKRYGIPMVILTADPSDQFVRAAAKLGVADYITKSVLHSIDLPTRLRFVRDKCKSSVSTLLWEKLDEIKPYLSCLA
jgi:DNA-binding response OmpR family regulator